MNDEQTKTTDTPRNQVATPVEKGDRPLNIVDEAKSVRDEIVKAKEELQAENDRKEKNAANELLGGTSGGHVDAPLVSEEQQRKDGAKEFFKGTALEDAIDKL